MRLGLISDVHGNAVALESCLSALSRLHLDQVCFLGDAVGYFPGEVDVLARLEAAEIECQQGNHEDLLLNPLTVSPDREAVYRLEGARARLNEDALSRIRNWPQKRELTIDGKRVLLVHGAPDAPLEGYLYSDSDLSSYENLPYDAIFMAHTHRPFTIESHGRQFVNAGSIGLPRDQGNLTSFAVYDTETGTSRICRVPMDTGLVMKRYGADIHEDIVERLNRETDNPIGDVLA